MPTSPDTSIVVRPYTDGDARPTLEAFVRAIRETAAGDYTPAQIAAWLGSDRDAATWDAQRRAVATRVAVLDGRIAGFADLDPHGHVDMLFVHPDRGGRGVASALLHDIVRAADDAGLAELTVEASVTARPVFERHGFVLLEEQSVPRGGERLTNFRMRRPLPGP
ncbi:GNAT family N-acetyltransferase [Patulibacter americanus]|uniref:GNAT family N-acetyltransferase n=1 Tax=Patulibacter americanus TaxID=588672 RepID=UPI0003B2FB8B|nr:GNAT family N-acetyltransferase [Patulibacter americanus]